MKFEVKQKLSSIFCGIYTPKALVAINHEPLDIKKQNKRVKHCSSYSLH